MKKLLRVLWLVVSFIVLFPAIVFIEVWWLIKCLRLAKFFNEPIKMGLEYWMYTLKSGIAMNKDFVINGL